jgi:hypothetical protein
MNEHALASAVLRFPPEKLAKTWKMADETTVQLSSSPLPEAVNDLPLPRCGADVWTASSFPDGDDPEWLGCFSEAEVAALGGAADAVLAASASEGEIDMDAVGRVLTETSELAPLLARLRELCSDTLLKGRGFAVLRGLPVAAWGDAKSAAAFLLLCRAQGPLRQQNAAGHVLGHVIDLGLASSDPSVRVYQTTERQTFHTDSCDVVGLLSLRAAVSGGTSSVVSAGAVFNALRASRPDLLRLLLQPLATDRRGEVPPGALPFFSIPVFSWHAGQLSVIYQRQYIDSAQRFLEAPRLTPAHVEALDAFDALCNDPSMQVSGIAPAERAIPKW